MYLPLLYLKALSFRRLWNIIVVELSRFLSDVTKTTICWGMPWSVSIEPASFCNLQCLECPTGKKEITRKKQYIDQLVYEKAIQQLSPTTFYLMLYFQGEPFLHPRLFSMIRIAKTCNMFVMTSTNGHFLTKEIAEQIVLSGLDKIMISLDGTTATTYNIYRQGGDFEIVIQGIKNLAQAKNRLKKRHPFIELQFLVMKHNQHQMPEMIKLSKNLGANRVTFKSCQVYSLDSAFLLPEIKRYNRYTIQQGKLLLHKKIQNRCRRIWRTAVITTDSEVVPCCFDKDADHSMGTLADSPIRKIWKSRQFNTFRKTVLKKRDSIDLCCNCTE
jgi:MoaA/NifB/PqqE/SkfB family radical SAM enzyme